MADARQVALKALDSLFFEEGFSNLTLDKFLSKYELSGVEASFCTSLFYGVVERKLTLDYVIEKASGKKIKKLDSFIVNILRMGVYQIFYMGSVHDGAAVNESVKLAKKTKKPFLSGFVNAVLRNTVRERENLFPPKENLSAYYSCDESIVNGLIKDYGTESAVAVLEHSLTSAPTTVRVNTLKTDKKELVTLLQSEGIECEEMGENLLKIKKSGNIRNSSAYKNGLIHIQSEVSSLTAEILGAKKGDKVLDSCAAPGGKSFTIAEIMENEGEITSLDLYPHRVELIEKGAKRLSISIIKPTVADATTYNSGEYQKILCDVPCSGLGMIAEKPDIKYNSGVYENTELPEIQMKILKNCSALLQKGGRMVYSTCTLRKAENEEVVETFLRDNPEFTLINQKTYLPHIDNTSGFFVAVIERH